MKKTELNFVDGSHNLTPSTVIKVKNNLDTDPPSTGGLPWPYESSDDRKWKAAKNLMDDMELEKGNYQPSEVRFK